MNKLLSTATMLFWAVLSFAQTNEITFADLLKEMTERSSLTYFPSPQYSCKQASSYSRDSKDPKTALEDGKFKPESGRDWGIGWFENHDFSQYIRTEENNGRKEDVMFDAKGPGAIVRFWATFGGIPDQYGGIYRIYIDDNPIPVIEMHNKNLVGKAGLVGKPFSFFAPEKTENDTWRGSNLILPIPYNKSCKITYDGEHKYAHIEGWSGHYYQINYRTYKEGTNVESFSKETLSKYKTDIEKYGEKLNKTQVNSNNLTKLKDIEILPGNDFMLQIDGEKAINEIRMKLKAEDMNQALRSTVLSIEFDKRETVWCPIGQFFGIGYKLNEHKTYYQQVDDDGLMRSKWVMPFKQKAVIRIKNLGQQKVILQKFELTNVAYEWNEGQSMYFHTTWKETRDLESELRTDYNYISIDGKGVFVGDNLTLFNFFPDTTGINWWGEGDEKIYVDGEVFPSHFGTGTEDYYSYAWCRPQAFSAPNVSQPCGEGNKTPGHTSNNRHRLLDAIPFVKSFQFDMEIWHPYRAKMNYAPATFFYALPGAKYNVKPSPQAAKQKLVLKIE